MSAEREFLGPFSAEDWEALKIVTGLARTQIATMRNAQQRKALVDDIRRLDQMAAKIEAELTRCPSCDGTGRGYTMVPTPRGAFWQEKPKCEPCGGTGKVPMPRAEPATEVEMMG